MVGGGAMHQSRNLLPPQSHPERQSWDFTAEGVLRGSCVVAADGTIYFVTTPTEAIHAPAQLYAMTPDGRPKWKVAAKTYYQASPAIGADGTVYVGDDTNLAAFTPSGALKWRLPLGETVLGSPTIGLDGTIYITTTQDELRGALVAVSPDGSIRWSAEESNRTVRSSSPAVLADGTLVTMQVSVFVGSVDGYSARDGAHTFSQPHGFVYPYNVFPVAGAGGAIYVSTDDGLERFEGGARTASLLLQSESPPAVGSDGTIYPGGVAIAAGGSLYSVGRGGPRVVAARPDGSIVWSLQSAQNGAAEQLYVIAPDGTPVHTFNDFAGTVSSLLTRKCFV